jgi:Sulfite reductase, alpha subunit (flavoprotein)
MFTETVPSSPVAAPHSRKNPFLAPLLKRRRLDGPGSEKETFHYEFSLADSGLVFEPGDSLGVFPQNAPALVDEIINLLGFSGEEEVAGGRGKA